MFAVNNQLDVIYYQSVRNNLPEPRKVSAAFHTSQEMPDQVHSLMTMQFGQFLDHDITFTPEVEEAEPLCCEEPTVITVTHTPCKVVMTVYILQ